MNMSLPKRVLHIPESEWYPQHSAFQVYPRRFPQVARHSIHTHPIDWPKVAKEIYDAFGLTLIGEDGRRWAYFADWTYSR